MNIEGKIILIEETKQITESFTKREFVVEYSENPEYPEYIKFELIQDKCSQLDYANIGDEVNVQFNLKGRKWNDPKGGVKYFNSLQAWKIEVKKSQKSIAEDMSSNIPDKEDSPLPF